MVRLDVSAALRCMLSTTNPIKSALCVTRRVTARVTRWSAGDIRGRWCAAGLLLHHGTFFPFSDFFRQPGPQSARTRVEPIACTRPQQLSVPREDEPPLISTTFGTTSPFAAEATE